MAWNKLYKLEFEYKDIHKDIFIDRHDHLDMIKDGNNFLTRIKDLKSYVIEFEKNNKMKQISTYPITQLGRLINE